MKKDSKQRLFEVMGRLDSTFKPRLNENVQNMSGEEQQILNDILSVNEGGGDWWNKFIEYGRKVLLTSAIVLSLAFSTQATNNNKSGEVITHGIEMVEPNYQKDILNFIISYTTERYSEMISQRIHNNVYPDMVYMKGLRDLGNYAFSKRDGMNVTMTKEAQEVFDRMIEVFSKKSGDGASADFIQSHIQRGERINKQNANF